MTKKIDASLVTGIVSSVEMKKNSVVCEVQGFRVQSNYSPVIVPSRFRFEARTPEGGDKVTIQKTDQGYWVLRDVLSTESEYSLPSLDEGEWVIKFDEDTEIRVVKDGSGNHDLVLSASGDVVVDEGGSSKPVAYRDHTHSFTYDGSGDNSSQQSGTTDTPPTDDGTEVEIE
jgi:hypothetical protein